MRHRLAFLWCRFGAPVPVAAVFLSASVHISDIMPPVDVLRSYGRALAATVNGVLDTAYGSHAIAAPEGRQVARLQIDTGKPDETTRGPIASPRFRRIDLAPGGRATLRGVATPGVFLAVKSAGKTLGRIEVAASGRWHMVLDSNLSAGDHVFLSVARWPGAEQTVRGDEVRVSVPKSLAGAPPAADGATDAEVRLAQRAEREPDNDEKAAQDQSSTDALTDPLVDWLRRSSEAYDQVIVRDLSGGRGVFPGTVEDYDERREPRDRLVTERDDGEVSSTDAQRRPETGSGIGIVEEWQSLTAGLWQWLRQARESYSADIVSELSVGEPVSRDRYVRGEEEPDRDPQQQTRQQPDTQPENQAGTTPDPLSSWPVVETDDADVEPDPPTSDRLNEDLIRRAEEETEKARELASQLAEQAEQSRRATKELLAEEKRLADEAAARDAEAQRFSEQESAQDADRSDDEADPAQASQRQKPDTRSPQRKAAEDLAAAATERADREFAAGRVQQAPEVDAEDPFVDEAPERDFVADAPPDEPRRLSLKDTRSKRPIEEGSTMEIDDFHPSVRYIYDMGPYKDPQVKRITRKLRKARRATRSAGKKRYKQRAVQKRYKKRNAKRTRASKKRARSRRLRSKRRAYRVRRGDSLWRIARRFYGHGRRYRWIYKGNRKRIGNPHRIYARQKIFIPRLKWRRR